MAIDYAADVARLNSLTEQALAKFAEDAQDQQFAEHTTRMLDFLDGWIERRREINQLRADRGRKRAQDRSEQVTAIEKRLITLRALVNRSETR